MMDPAEQNPYVADARLNPTGDGRERLEEMIIHLRNQLDKYPDDPDILTRFGDLLYRKGDPKGAEDYFRKALKVASDYPEALYNLGYLLSTLGRTEEAKGLLRKVVEVEARGELAMSAEYELWRVNGDYRPTWLSRRK